MRNQLAFFGTATDLAAVLARVEAARPLQYAAAGLFDSQGDAGPFPSGTDTINTSPDASQSPCYLVLPSSERLVHRSVPQRRGGAKYAVDQLANPKSVALRVGGVYRDDCLLA